MKKEDTNPYTNPTGTYKKAVIAGQFIKEENYWIKKLSGEVAKAFFPYDYETGNKENTPKKMETVEFTFEKELMARFMKLRNGSDSHLHMILTAGLVMLLNRITESNDIIVAAPALKQAADVKFINTVLPLRHTLHQQMTFKQLLHHVKETVVEATRNQNFPVETLPYRLNMPFSETTDFPLFDISILLENIHDNKYLQHISHNVSFSFLRQEESIAGAIHYNSSLYRRATVEALAARYNRIFDVAFANIDIPISRLSILSQTEEQRLLTQLCGREQTYPSDHTISQLFQLQVEKTPHLKALSGPSLARVNSPTDDKENNVDLSYEQLNQKANQLARKLRAKGVKAETLVGVIVKPSVEMGIAILAILKAGGAYLPIDPQYPQHRIRYMLDDGRANLLLAQRESIAIEGYSGEILDLEDQNLYQGDEDNLLSVNTSAHLAYVIYTSGSSGKAKGVQIEHRNVLNYIYWRINEYEQRPEDACFQLVSFSFDGFCANFYPTLLSGGRVVFLNEEKWTDGAYISKIIKQEKITHFSLVPSLFKVILYGAHKEDSSSLRFVVLAGEKAAKGLIEQGHKMLPHVRMVNEYGPTENSVTSTANCNLTLTSAAIIGKPITNNKVFILDRWHGLRPIGMAGELWVSSAGLSRGYLNRAQLTSEKFVSNPFVEGQKMFRTGDLARWLEDGNIEFLGRVDQQVKIRGFRIELGEIENCLARHECINDTIVIDRINDNGDHFLYAFYTSEQPIDSERLKNYLGETLPYYMIPAQIIPLPYIPLTPNGKLDLDALPDADAATRAETAYEAPVTGTELALTAIWQEELSVEKIGINDNFFGIGGCSLKATTLLSKIHKTLNVKVPLKEFFKRPAIRQLANYIQDAGKCAYVPIKKADKAPYYPLSSAQKRLFLVYQLDPQGLDYNMPACFLFEGPMDTVKFQQAFHQLIQRHEMFRTSFHLVGDGAVQKVQDTIDFEILVDDLGEEEAEEQLYEFVEPFDLSSAPLSRAKLIRLGGEKYFFLLDMHHIISDGFSMDLLLKEFSDLYSGKNLPPLEIQYKDYAIWQQQSLEAEIIKKQETYWLERIKGFTFTLLPIDNFNSYNYSEGGAEATMIDKATYKKIDAFCNSQGVTRFMLLISIFQIILAKEIGQEDLTIGIPSANRDHPDIKKIMGFFLNLLLIRSGVKTGLSFKENLAFIKQDILGAMENNSYPYELLSQQIRKRENLKSGDLFTILVDYFPTKENKKIFNDQLKVTPIGSRDTVLSPKYDVILYIMDTQQEMGINLVYRSNIYKKYKMKRILDNFVSILHRVLEQEDVRISDIHITDSLS